MNITWNADDYEKGFGFVPDYVRIRMWARKQGPV